MTSLMDMECKIKGIHLGSDDYLVKPVNRFELKIITKALAKKKAYIDSLFAGQDQNATTESL